MPFRGRPISAKRSYAEPMREHSDNPEEAQRTIVVRLSRSGDRRVQHRIIERAIELNWRIVDLQYYDSTLPAGLVPDGALTDALWNEPLARQLRKVGCHAVRVGQFPHPRDGHYPAVVADLTATGRLAAEHFAERNFHHVGFVSYHLAIFHFKHLYDPFVARATELGCQCHLLDFGKLTEEQGTLPQSDRQKIRDLELAAWLENIDKPIGMLGFNDGISAKICALSVDLGFSVPGDIAVLSCGNDPMECECAPIRLSALNRSGPEEADVAVDLLRELMDGKQPPSSTVVVAPPGVTVRESTDVLATTNPTVARAVRFMWDHLDQELCVDDIADAIDVPRRTLERTFRLQLGRGVNAELLRRRLEYCCDLLRSTDLAIVDIVPMIGFRSTAYLHNVFRRTFGMTPMQWRAAHST